MTGRTWGVAVAAMALAVAGCSPAGTPVASPAPSGSPIKVELSLQEYSITPKAVTIHGGQLTIEAHNAGKMSHALSLTGEAVSLSTRDLSFDPGTTESITATLAAGTYTFFCPVDGHRQLGMEGTLTVLP
jgi:uncharacterized cupredoxin-like copper-binding protein